MLITGHKTRAVFDRHHIVNNTDIAEALGKLAKFHEAAELAPQSNIINKKGSFGRTGTSGKKRAVLAKVAGADRAR
jgi:hypothetical protein